MPRYYFHVVSPRNPVRDAHGVELAGLDAAHWHAMHLVYRLREHAPETGEDWVIEVSDETGARPLVVLPRAVPMLREARTPTELGGGPSQIREGIQVRGIVGTPSPVSQMRAGLSPLVLGV
jgi:hypothetical protein